MSQLTLYNAASRAQPRRGESFVGLQMGGDDVGPVPSPGGGSGEKKEAVSGTNETPGQGTRPTVFLVATKNALAMRPFPRKRHPTEFSTRLLTGCNPDLWGPRPSRSHPSASRRRLPFVSFRGRFLPIRHLQSASRIPQNSITDDTDGHGCERPFIRVNP